MTATTRMNSMLEQNVEREQEFIKVQKSLDRVEETITSLKRKNAGANAMKNLMDKHAKPTATSGDMDEEVGGQLQEDFSKFKAKVEKKIEQSDYKFL